jgi:cytochrome c peroxidase
MKAFNLVSILFLFGIVSIALSPAKTIKTPAQLGQKLFNDTILSKDYTLSCASCHIPAYGFADTVAFSKGINGQLTTRNTPSVLNMKFRPYFFWDGRASTLEEQALMPISNPQEMGLPIVEAVKRLNNHPEYKALFLKIFKQIPNPQNLGKAIAAFEKTLETGQSTLDLWANGKATLTAAEERGRELFISDKSKCFDCHRGEDFTQDEFRNIGLYNGEELNDAGLGAITKKVEDMGKFKTPGLRNIALTAPYMHNGMFSTLEQVVDYYNNPVFFVGNSINTDSLLQTPLHLSRQEKADLVAFLKTLTDRRFAAKQQ